LNADHRSMVKFNAVSDPGFIRVLSVLEDTLQIVREDAALQVPQGLISNNTEELKFDETEESQYFKHFKSVGQGGFGFVDIVEAVIEKEGKPKLLEGDAERSASRRYARKTVPIMDNVPLLKLADLRREAENLKKVIHRHIAKLELDYLKENDKGKIFFVLITSPYANGDMRNFLVHKRIFAVEPWEHYHRQQVLRWFGCLARAVQFLHKHNIRHMDIKPENILVHAENVLLTDFGISKDMSSSFDGRTRGPLSVEKGEYFAPEIIQKQERGYESDIFSLGCVFLEMLTDFCGIKYSELHKELEDSHKKAQAVCNVCKDDPSRKEDRFDYHHHPVKTLQWLFSLVTKCDKNDFWANKDDHSMRPLRLAPLDWTFAMLQPDEKHRVKTDALVKAIHAVEEATKSSKIALALPTNGALEVFICGDCSEDTVAPSIKHSVASMKLSKGLPWVADVVPRSWDDANASLRWVDPHDRGPSDAG
jgi:serine/threonine protein kinase